MRLKVQHLLAVAALSTAVAGCGSDATPDPPLPPPGAGPGAVVPSVTDGRVGDATTASSGRSERLLASGGRIRPGAGASPRGEREGVDGAADCGALEVEPTPATLDPIAATTVCLLNVERTSRGLVALTENPKLAAAAAVHAKDMVARLFFAHESPDGSTPVERIRAAGYIPVDKSWTVGENLAWGSGALATPAAIVRAWMNSPGHRDNVLKPDYREIGISVVAGVPKEGITGGATFATTFGALQDPQPAEPVAAPVEVSQPVASAPTARVVAAKVVKRVRKVRKVSAKALKARKAAAAKRAAAARKSRSLKSAAARGR